MSRRNSPSANRSEAEGGFTLIVLLVVVCIIAVIVWLRPFLSDDSSQNNTPTDTIKTYHKAQDDLSDIQKRLEERNTDMLSTSTKN